MIEAQRMLGSPAATPRLPNSSPLATGVSRPSGLVVLHKWDDEPHSAPEQKNAQSHPEQKLVVNLH
jgi:hypothetical protein